MPASSPVPEGASRFVLTAREGGRVLARLEGHVLAPRLLHAGRLTWEEGIEAPRAWPAFAEAMRAHLAPTGGEVLVWESERTRAWRDALEDSGFALARRKVFVARSLVDALPPAPAGLVLTSLADAGEGAFLDRMTVASEGDPFEERKGVERDPLREWRERVEGAGERFDPNGWFLVDDAAGPLGVLLPQATEDDEGTLYYVAVLPARRGEGRGRDLHAAGLRMLAARGLQRYIGSTDLRNEAMRRVFERNACVVKGTQLFFELPAPARGSRRSESGS